MSSPDRPSRAAVGEVLAIVLAFAFSVHLVDPRGDMPLNDDWNFALATWTFAETGEFDFARLTGMSLRSQVVWGAAWTKLFGESFEVLRMSTLALSLLTLVILLRLLTRLGIERDLRLVATLALLFHPIFFWSSFTFMTHVPFLFMSLIALYCFSVGVTEDRTWLIASGSLAVVISFFIRQTGLATSIAAAIVILMTRREDRRKHALIAAAPVPLFLLLWFTTDWLVGYPGQISEHADHLKGGIATAAMSLVSTGFSHAGLSLMFSAIFFLPLLILAFPRKAELRKALPALLLAAIPLAWLASGMISRGQAIPGRFREDIFGNLRLGPQTLRDHWVFGYPYPLHLPELARAFVTVTAALLALAVVYRLAAAWREEGGSPRRFVARLSVGMAVCGTGILVASSIFFDRYSLDALWPLAIVLALGARDEKGRMGLSAAALLLLAFFSISATAEYFAWNRARWEAFAWLQGRGVTLRQMDGGYEINQYLLGGRHGEVQLERAGMSVVDDRYILSLTEVRGYRTLTTFPYRAPLSFGSRDLYVQERVGRGFIPEFGLE